MVTFLRNASVSCSMRECKGTTLAMRDLSGVRCPLNAREQVRGTTNLNEAKFNILFDAVREPKRTYCVQAFRTRRYHAKLSFVPRTVFKLTRLHYTVCPRSIKDIDTAPSVLPCCRKAYRRTR